MTAATEAARHASVETALAATAGQIWLRLRLLRPQPPRNSRKQQRALSSVKEVLVESIPMPEAQSAYLTAVAEAGTYASEEISLAATASHFTAAEVASVPTAEQLAEVAAELLSFERVEVESTSMPEAQSVDVTATVK